MDVKQFKENLAFYGADIYQWPEDLQHKYLNALKKYPELEDLRKEEKEFENFLLSSEIEAPDPHLAGRIISTSAAVDRKEPFSVSAFLVQLFGDFRLPQPAFAALLLVIIGIAIGFSNPFEWGLTEQVQTNLYDFLYYDGEVI